MSPFPYTDPCLAELLVTWYTSAFLLPYSHPLPKPILFYFQRLFAEKRLEFQVGRNFRESSNWNKKSESLTFGIELEESSSESGSHSYLHFVYSHWMIFLPLKFQLPTANFSVWFRNIAFTSKDQQFSRKKLAKYRIVNVERIFFISKIFKRVYYFIQNFLQILGQILPE